MKYSHKTTHSFTPPIEFWRSIENLFLSFPFRKDGNIFKSRDELIKYYEMKTQEVFDIDDEGLDIYGNKFRKEFLKKWNRDILLSDIPKSKKKLISPGNIIVKTNHLGKIIKFLSTNVSNSETVFKFQHFIESIYQYAFVWPTKCTILRCDKRDKSTRCVNCMHGETVICNAFKMELQGYSKRSKETSEISAL